jgi:hypothetical protein
LRELENMGLGLSGEFELGLQGVGFVWELYKSLKITKREL